MTTTENRPLVTVTGANGLVGARTCVALADRGADVRAVVRRAGTAPAVAGVTEWVGDFTAADFAARVVEHADAVVSTVHPMGSDRATQHRIGVEGTTTLARAAVAAQIRRLVHVSTAAVYDRSPGVGDVDESAALVGDDAGDYAVTKRDVDLVLAALDGITRVLVRPPAILGAGETSMWNTLRPAAIRDDEQARHARPDQTFAWVHVTDLAAFLADAATDGAGVAGGTCAAVNVAAGPATVRDYVETVARALGVEPVWDDGPVWSGQIRSDRARSTGWRPTVTLQAALAEIGDGLRR